MSTGYHQNIGDFMNLKEYIHRNNISILLFCKKLGITHGTLYRIINGHDLMLSTAMKINEETHGAVTLQDLAKAIKPSATKRSKKLPSDSEGLSKGET